MALVDRLRSCTHDHLAFLLSGKVDQRQVRLFLGHGQRGQTEQGGEQGAHVDLFIRARSPAKPVWGVIRRLDPSDHCYPRGVVVLVL